MQCRLRGRGGRNWLLPTFLMHSHLDALTRRVSGPASLSGNRSMFTGLVEGLGSVVSLTPDAVSLTLRIAAPADLPGPETVRLGDSIALNGCCLTVVAIEGRTWSFQAGSETLSRTNLGQLQIGDVVNVER